MVPYPDQAGVETAVLGWVCPEGVGTVGVVEEAILKGAQVPLVAGDVAKGSDGPQDFGLGAGVEVGLQGGEDGEQSMDVVDTNAHLWVGRTKTYVHTHTFIHTGRHTHPYIHVHTGNDTHSCTHTGRQTYTHIHTYRQTDIHTAIYR